MTTSSDSDSQSVDSASFIERNQSSTQSKTQQLIVRVVYGAGYAVLTLVALLLGRWTTTALICLYAGLCCFEFFKMMRMAGRNPNEIIGIAAAIGFPLAAHFSYHWVAILFYVFAAATGIWFVQTPRSNISDVALTIFGPIYTGLLFTSVIRLRAVDPSVMGGVCTFLAMSSIWLNDTFAYFVGSRFGKHKMAPRISPKKSWEGFIGGMFGSILVWVFLSMTLLPMSLFMAICTGLATGLMGVFGDLLESRIKRGVGVKDSGNLMPGHGGMLDRSDSLLFGLIAATFILTLGGII
ncbi:MAG: phosphatidate cytidylyltransferase [Atopobium sp.]|uniref:phosphatidate cytidylyltransferase n=1 Tax=Atopobium sp. TaxID=1872650 RepID=UPI002A74EDEC|nr:phosphatidate cytidylyltransferase [Atopobium sp.]MDY2789013.1 phosphatidate cytidylyltransferase [Atopobium sp.]